jgi:DNA-binding CsgD family transcriptional regulator
MRTHAYRAASNRRFRHLRAAGCAPLGRARAGRARRHRGDAATARPATIDELTPRELRIALRLAGGKTIREVAAAQCLSPKTIDYHLRHVCQKLNPHSREELARAVADQTRAAASGSAGSG